MLTINLFRDFRVLIILSIFLTSCECCCDCDNMVTGTLTMNITLPTTYPGRTCAIPIAGGDFTTLAGENIRNLESANGGSLRATQYVLYVEYESCCDDFAYSAAFQALQTAGTAIAWQAEQGNKKPWTFRYALNTTGGNATPSIPVPKSDDMLSLTVHYWEPCMTGGGTPDCDPACSSSLYRVMYETSIGILYPGGSNSVTLPITLMHANTFCGGTGHCGP